MKRIAKVKTAKANFEYLTSFFFYRNSLQNHVDLALFRGEFLPKKKLRLANRHRETDVRNKNKNLFFLNLVFLIDQRTKEKEKNKKVKKEGSKQEK